MCVPQAVFPKFLGCCLLSGELFSPPQVDTTIAASDAAFAGACAFEALVTGIAFGDTNYRQRF